MIVLHLSTFQSVLLVIVAFGITLFFVLGAVVMGAVLALIKKVKKVVAKAEDAIVSVEEATETIKNIGAQAGGPLAFFKIVKNLHDTFNKDKSDRKK